ncbi:Hypothetical predicted protein [Scomber scombrus]|uniref:Uncharacterized protein n=1 Tax=Scomber scombrus TaxID=13677 RepID=A0AAV1PC00_SCOSC
MAALGSVLSRNRSKRLKCTWKKARRLTKCAVTSNESGSVEELHIHFKKVTS